jgi:hypothetical protein
MFVRDDKMTTTAWTQEVERRWTSVPLEGKPKSRNLCKLLAALGDLPAVDMTKEKGALSGLTSTP